MSSSGPQPRRWQASGHAGDMTPLPDLLHDAARAGPGAPPAAGLPGPAAAVQRGLPGRGEHPGLAGRHPGRAARAGLAAAGRGQPVPAIHGRVCYHPCETVCNRAELDSAVSIHAVERFLGDLALEHGWAFDAPPAATGRRVLVIGAGPERAVRRLPPGPAAATRWRSGTPAPSRAG